MNIKKITTILKNEPKYRLKQVKQAVFCDLIANWDEATNLPKTLREKLKAEAPLELNYKLSNSTSSQSLKALVEFSDHKKIETVLIRHKDGRNTICVSSQVGCPCGCTFCATGRLGFDRNLTASEIISQVLLFARHLKELPNSRISNVVFMGMGEPMLNYDEVMEAVDILNDPDGLNIGARKISISTVGIVDGIKKLAGERKQINLAVSLHAPTDHLRSDIIPINQTYSINMLMRAVDKYIEHTGRRVMFEYLLIKGVNDSPENARELAELLKGKSLCFVNLIPYNPTAKFQPSPPEVIKKFKQVLEKAHITVTERHRFGRDIKAACGQLAAHQ